MAASAALCNTRDPSRSLGDRSSIAKDWTMDAEPFPVPDFIAAEPIYGHGHLDASTQTGLAVFYLLVVILNVGYAIYQFYVNRNRTQAFVWALVAVGFFLLAAVYIGRLGLVLPQGFRSLTTNV